MESNTRNFHAHGGSEWVIGGKLTFLPTGKLIFMPGAEAEGLPGGGAAPRAPARGAPVIPYIPDSDAATAEQLRDSFNQLLAAMRAAGLMAAEEGARKAGM